MNLKKTIGSILMNIHNQITTVMLSAAKNLQLPRADSSLRSA